MKIANMEFPASRQAGIIPFKNNFVMMKHPCKTASTNTNEQNMGVPCLPSGRLRLRTLILS